MATGLARIVSASRSALLASVALVALSACATNRTAAVNADYSNLSGPQIQATVADLASRYRNDPRDATLGIHYAAALRAAGQTAPAVQVMEYLVGQSRGGPAVSLAYAKALAADGRFDQALSVLGNTMDPVAPDWEALSVKGAILDQMGQHEAARQAYSQALLLAPDRPALHANMGLSYSMTGDLRQAEQHLRYAVSLPGASTRVRQNLALVLGLQGRFDEARAIYAQELPAEEVEANMAYIRAMLTQQNRWDEIRGDTQG
ncbi:tetratricopeptide repeat protein [Pelagibacterium xiamenense]|uniref:tetratricopeptide repeat protein n=1 Tax=Pelagibacterium xiamenense TaxID=2901140 RepID=UPI001E40A6F9|nr:tetratricopeptide repeat protein [Pelagibacterium xiamenense]MCD7058876.1 tetratricopeptide repeat protein [Pelagibacterium xiamenense]